jgi:hypothetical protein
MVPFREPLPQPGQALRWRHPRRALALGWFQVFGPGPFEFIELVEERGKEIPLTFLIQTEFGQKAIDAAWVGPVTIGPRSASTRGMQADSANASTGK